MNRELIVDGVNVGQAVGYRQNREREQWVFLMAAGYYISIDWSNIKRFESGGEDLKVDTFQGVQA